MAVEIDPDYGPSYNDMGTYCLQEGDLKEALRWFQLAKKAPLYQNREYPYINSGRVYLMKKQYRSALKEFHLAKDLAPFSKNLVDTINKIEDLLKDSQHSTPLHSPYNGLNNSMGDINSDVNEDPWKDSPIN